MQDRSLTPLDRLLAGIGDALRIVVLPVGRPARPNPASTIAEAELDEREKAHAAGLMRVNHAGEIAAQGLYQGHATVARHAGNARQMQQAANEELDHLAWCEQRLTELDAAPSRLSPLWYAGSFVMGAASGILGDKWSLAFIAETERQVCDHLGRHLEKLPQVDARSRAIVEQMRVEEQQHGENAIAAGAATLPEPVRQLMRLTSKIMTTTAYRF
ncbi:MAG: 2-polyprenyl-3-methyl-6-methoxy-1,4-benzoquinone monooxygenase [Gammaproteobacteria bacterium]|nr:2-polyprenyl-3-methyl-6-methoxy-1,4-benzoquinone monooxygenase [Gammaproteobacteria bacterium]MDH5302758.1 2-polyprenyl-3-methyl-6-methoxy-1,4-benzoquinone monooxygenase [Gammaproteobacteria bacterium]